VQLAAQLGADVTATIRSDAVELVRNLGARKVIDIRSDAVDDSQASYEVSSGQLSPAIREKRSHNWLLVSR
jgi:NADPH:quinone reductase-like Zn-dependent oxidoreductase